jgi:cytochrome c553
MNEPEARLGAIAWLSAAGVAAVAFVVGFVWLPGLQASANGLTLWDAFCRAVGAPSRARSDSVAGAAEAIPTKVVWNPVTVRVAVSGDVERGRALAAGCAGCHGAQGVSASDEFPNIAGLSAEAIYKQLDDYRSGKRANPIMQAMAAPLDDQKVADVAAYFSALSRGTARGSSPPPPLVVVGSPMRSIAPCAACHGPFGYKHGAPLLEGQKRTYLKAQLDAFAAGTRHNDINQQMREIARTLSAPERDALADWYAGRRAE